MDHIAQAAEVRARAAAVFSTLSKFAMSLKPDQVDQMLAGTAKLVLVSPGQQVVEPLVGLDQALKLLRGLSDDDRAFISDRLAKIALVRPGESVQKVQQKKAPASPLDLNAIAAELQRL